MGRWLIGYVREFGREAREQLAELRAERNWLGVGLVVLCVPLWFVATVIYDFTQLFGPE